MALRRVQDDEVNHRIMHFSGTPCQHDGNWATVSGCLVMVSISSPVLNGRAVGIIPAIMLPLSG